MSVVIDGTSGITTPAETVQGALTTTGNTILGDATTDTLTVGVTGIVKDASGNVGIGTASPASRLDVKSTAAGTADMRLSYSASDYMGLSSESDGYQLAAVGGTNALRFATGGSQRMRIDSSGNVGIGTASPTGFGGTNLHVQSSSASAYGSMLVGSGTYLFEILTNQNSGVMSVGTRSNHSLNISTNDQVQATITTAGLFQFNSGYGSVATAYGCRAWVNFNGTGTVAIRASGNVSSITDNSLGNFTANFTTAIVDANYSSVATCCPPGVNEGTTARIPSKTAGAFNFVTMDLAGNAADFAECNVSIFR